MFLVILNVFNYPFILLKHWYEICSFSMILPFVELTGLVELILMLIP